MGTRSHRLRVCDRQAPVFGGFVRGALRGDQHAKKVLDELTADSDTTSIATPTLMELRTSIALNTRETPEDQLINKIKASSILLPLDHESATRAGDIEAALILAGETIPPVDIMIGAIARQHNEVLLTRNAKHFKRIPGLDVRTY